MRTRLTNYFDVLKLPDAKSEPCEVIYTISEKDNQNIASRYN